MNRITLVLAAVVLAAVALAMTTASIAAEPPARFALALHGGALSDLSRLSPQGQTEVKQSLTKALTIGRDLLAGGGASLDAVEQVIRYLEDDPLFNAGRGAVFNAAEGHELDASVMDGRTLACGAVAGVRRVKNPISLARLVMTKTRHVLLMGDGAEELAEGHQIELVDPSYFSTDRQRRNLQRAREQQAKESKMGTVGCVALDRHGNLAAGTSTGGLTNKMFGRIGDSPIIGAGTYADNATVAVSCTGIGEQFIRHAVSFDVAARMKYQGVSADAAVSAILSDRLKPGDGGIIAVSAQGEIVLRHNTPGMSCGAADHAGRFEVFLTTQPSTGN